MVVLQSCTDSLQFLPGSSNETYPLSSDGTFDVRSIEVEEDVVVIDEGFTAINEEAAVHIKQEEIPVEVRYLFKCLLLVTFHLCPEMSFVFDHNISGH